MDKRHFEKPGKPMEHSSSDAAERFRRSLYTSPDRHQEQQELDEGRNTQQSWQTEAREGLRRFDQSSDTSPAHRELTHTQLQDAASFAARQSSPSNAEIAIQRRRSSRELREQQRDTGSEGERHIQEDPDSARRTVWEWAHKALHDGTRAITNADGTRDTDPIYNIYADSHRPATPLTGDQKKEFLQRLSEISERLKLTVYCHPQWKETISTHRFLERFPDGKAPDKEIGIYLATSRDTKKHNPVARLSIRLHPSEAIDAFDHAASELVDKHPDVYAAKLAGPPEIHLRPDSLILYLTKRNIESAKSIVQDFAVRFPDHFSNSALDDVPAGMYKLTSNTGYAEQFGRQSHGRALAHAIDSALQKYDDYVSRNKETKSEELLRRFDEEFLPSSFREHGIDPDAPYRNFPGPESSS